jgi:putative sigma-54 modulation protein
MVLDKLEKQIKRSKQKIRARRTNSKARAKRTIAYETSSFEDETEGQIKIKNIDYKPMDIEEAVLQLDLVSYNFLVFTNARTEKINVLYHRKDGHLGLIQPSK